PMIRSLPAWRFTLVLALFGASACGESSPGGSNDGTGGAPEMPGGSGGMSGSGGDAGTDPSCPDGCFIDGACFEANEENPDDSCQVCLPAKKASGWSTSAACCTEEDEPVSFGCDGTRVVGLSACDDVVSTEEDCADLPNRACRAGACACAPGRTGDDCEQPVLYVRPDGDDEASGTSWDEAFATVGAAL